MRKKSPFIFAGMLLFAFACKKEPIKDPVVTPEPTPTPLPVGETGSLKLEFQHMVDNEPLVFGKKYLNPKSDTFSVTRFTYYISNVILEKNDNSFYKVPESYYLINHAVPASSVLTIANIPANTYKSISYTIGVDSTRNCSGIQSGDLDPAKGMFWTWNSGYIFFKLEGKAPKAPNGSFTYHIGGYSGENKTQRNIFHELTLTPLIVAPDKNPALSVKVNINEVFKSPSVIDVSTENYIMTAGPLSKKMADNYVDMMSVLNVKN